MRKNPLLPPPPPLCAEVSIKSIRFYAICCGFNTEKKELQYNGDTRCTVQFITSLLQHSWPFLRLSDVISAFMVYILRTILA